MDYFSEIEEPRTALMRRECAWCKCEMPPVPCVPAMAERVSHGICPSCNLKVEQELAKLPPPPPRTTPINPIALLVIVILLCLAWTVTVHHFKH